MTILFEDYLNEVRAETPGCPENTMINAVRNASTELCEKSNLWRETLAPINVVQGADKYLLTSVNSEASVLTPLHVAYNGTPLVGKSEEELDRLDYKWRIAGENTPQFYLMESNEVLWLSRKPNIDIVGGLNVRVSLKPAANAIGADNFIYNDWHEAIAHGAKRRLMEMPEKKWTNLKLAMFHGAKFNFYLNQALAKSTKGNVKQSTTVQMIAW